MVSATNPAAKIDSTNFDTLPPSPETIKRRRGGSIGDGSVFRRAASIPEIPALKRSSSTSNLTSIFSDVNLSVTSESGSDGYYRCIPSQVGHKKIEQAKNSALNIMFKVGSTTLVDNKGNIKTEWISSFAETVKKLKDSGKQVSIVASGAVAAGRFQIPDLAEKPKSEMTIPEKQVAAGVGQPKLMKAIQDEFAKKGISISQDLVSEGDMKLHSSNRTNLVNKYNTSNQYHVIMVFNANDSVDTSQLMGGDNDALAIKLARILSKDTVVIFSDIMGYHTSRPVKHDIKCKHIPIVTSNTISHYTAGAGGPGSDAGNGGMAAKFNAIESGFQKDITTVITLGDTVKPGYTLFDKNDTTDATWFIPEEVEIKNSATRSVA